MIFIHLQYIIWATFTEDDLVYAQYITCATFAVDDLFHLQYVPVNAMHMVVFCFDDIISDLRIHMINLVSN